MTSGKKCPKCGFENPAAQAVCLRCGVIFARIRENPSGPGESAEPDVSLGREKQGLSIRELLVGVPEEAGRLPAWGRGLVLLGLGIWSVRLVLAGIAGNAAGESVLHLVNLPFHEFGHILFRPFGAFVTALGGTLGQLLVPLVCLAVLLWQTRDPFGAAVCLWWFGENFLDIAPYINDARAGVLPLVGGNTGRSAPYGFHDWEFILTEAGLLRYDHALARLSHAAGSLLMVLALAWAGYIVLRQCRNKKAGRFPGD